MTRFNSILHGGILGVALLLPCVAGAEPNTGKGPRTFNCAGVERTCGAWGAKGGNTCRTCQQAQCKTENGKEVIAGNKTQTECYEEHGSPPKRSGVKKPKFDLPKATTDGLNQKRAQ